MKTIPTIVMSKSRILSVAIFTASVALTASVQAQTAPAVSMPMAGGSMSHDCAKPTPKHDHGAERGTPSSKATPTPCGPVTAVSAPVEAASTPKKKPSHNHSTFHKTM